MCEPAAWSRPPLDDRIAEGEVRVWLGMLDELHGEPLEALLSSDERDRAAKFVFDHDRRRFVAARGLLRRLLASELHTDPRDLRFSYDRYGKPSLASHPAAPAFNVSHSRAAAVFALGRAGALGVDIESASLDARRRGHRRAVFRERRAGGPPLPAAVATRTGVLPLLDAQGSVHQGGGPGPEPPARLVRSDGEARRTGPGHAGRRRRKRHPRTGRSYRCRRYPAMSARLPSAAAPAPFTTMRGTKRRRITALETRVP